MSIKVHTWDFQNLRNTFQDGPVHEYNSPQMVPGVPDWASGLMTRETRPMTREEIREAYGVGGPNQGYRVTDRLLPAGEAWIHSMVSDLEKRFPHRAGSTDGFYRYTCPLRGGMVVYNPGFDMVEEWVKMFGRTAPMFLNSRRLPDGYRPWVTPTVFYDGQRSDYHMTDSVGAPYFKQAAVQSKIDWLYVFPIGSDSLAFVESITRVLGEAVKGWECRVQPG